MESATQKRPVIAITCGEIYNKEQTWTAANYGQTNTYVNAIIAAGGAPMLLPLTRDKALLEQLLSLCDGVCLAGGNDLHPRRYGQEPLATITDYSELRDATEEVIVAYALDHTMPILSICRGMQVLNVHLGGDLYQDIPTQLPSNIEHDSSNKLQSLVDLSHTLRIEPGSKLAGIVGAEAIGANAHHHQAIKNLGAGVRAVAWAEDGIIEAIEMPDYPYAVGVQAHPESLTKVEPRWAKLFSSFVTAAQPAANTGSSAK